MNTPRPIRFLHRGSTVEVGGAAPTRTVLEWLREDARCTGTKEGCAEGDCGACTVVIGEIDAQGALRLAPVNACIQFLPTLDGKALFTVEDLAPLAGGRPHPVQQAMVDCHGSQCGFCTPGIVMSLFATYERHQACGTRASRQQLADDLSGNLCRCTGYRPILDAGEQMFAAEPVRLDREAVAASLQVLRRDPPLHYEAGGAHFHAPRSLEDLAALREARPDARLLAGSTDVGLWVTKQFRPLGDIVWIGAVEALRRVERRDGVLSIGAGASLEEAWRALVREWPPLQDLWLRFASLPVREAGTMGGNVANGSPIGDSAPVLMALDATIVLRKGTHVRRMKLAEFYVDYMKNRLESGEFVQALEVPLPDAATTVRAYKISKRFDCDISAVCAGLAVTLDDAGTVTAARLAFGGMAATVRHARGAEAAITGRRWDRAALEAAQAALAADFTPLSDMRGSAAFRARVARNLLERFWLETRPDDPLAAEALSVFVTPARAGA
jgi:xanthine dehydrogenase small subunit